MHVSCAEMALWSEADKENLGVPLAIIKGIKVSLNPVLGIIAT